MSYCMTLSSFFYCVYYAIRYVATEHSKDGTVVQLNVRGKMVPAQITKTPFIETTYYKSS